MAIQKIDMQSDTFQILKNDMSIGINELLRNMQEFGVDEAEMTVKLKITLNDDSIKKEGKSIPVTVPVFKHKVSYTVQSKAETEGTLQEDFVLEGDGHGGYKLVPRSEQLRMA